MRLSTVQGEVWFYDTLGVLGVKAHFRCIAFLKQTLP